VINDGMNQYLYDGDGRICAVGSEPVLGTTIMTGYIYGADGLRVSKGSITTMSCEPTINGCAVGFRAWKRRWVRERRQLCDEYVVSDLGSA